MEGRWRGDGKGEKGRGEEAEEAEERVCCAWEREEEGRRREGQEPQETRAGERRDGHGQHQHGERKPRHSPAHQRGKALSVSSCPRLVLVLVLGFCCVAPGMFFLSPGRAEKRRCLRPRSVIHRQWPWRYQKRCCTTQGGDDDRKRPETDRQIFPHASPHPLAPYITFLRIGIASPHPPALPVVLRPPKHLRIPPRNIFSTICALPRVLSPSPDLHGSDSCGLFFLPPPCPLITGLSQLLSAAGMLERQPSTHRVSGHPPGQTLLT